MNPRALRFAVLPAMVAVAGFAAGWRGVRWMGEINGAAWDEQAVTERPIPDASDSIGPIAGTAAKEWSAALAGIGEQRGGMAGDAALAAALLRLEAADFPAGAGEMLAQLERLQKPFDPRAAELAEAWMDRWLEIDAPGALRFLDSTPFLTQLRASKLDGWPLSDRANIGAGGIFKALARREPEWTRQTVAGLEPGALREVGVYALLSEVAQRDAAQAARFLAAFSEKADRPAAVTGYVTGLAASNLRSAFEAASAESPGQLRDVLLWQIFFWQTRRLGVSGTRELLEQIGDPAERRKQAAEALAALAFEGREDVLPFVREESARMAAEGMGKAEYQDWAGSVQVLARGPQVHALAEWAADFAPDKERVMFGVIVSDFAVRKPALFGAWLKGRAATLDAAQIEKVGAALTGMAERDPAAARALAEALPPGALRDQTQFQIALASGKEGDVAQAAAAYRSVAAGDAKGALAAQLAKVLARQNGAAAAEWAGQQAPGPARTAALRVVAEVWSERDVHGAAQWLERMPAGTERDSAVRTYAEKITVADPEAAAEWVGQVADPALRTQTASKVYERWRIENPVAARAWLRDLPGVEPGLLEKYMRNGQ